MVILDKMVYFVYKESKCLVLDPLKLGQISALVMSPSQPMSAAFKLNDAQNMRRSHVIFQNFNMGILVRYF